MAAVSSDFMLVNVHRQRSHTCRRAISQLGPQDRSNVAGGWVDIEVRLQYQRQGWKPRNQEQVQQTGLSDQPGAHWNLLGQLLVSQIASVMTQPVWWGRGGGGSKAKRVNIDFWDQRET